MARIALDASYTLGAYPTGSATYSRRLIESLAQLDTSHDFLVCYRMSRLRKLREFLRPPGTMTRLITPWLARRTDLFHSLAQRPPKYRFRREVVTIHDILPITGRGYSTPEYQQRFAAILREAAARAHRIVTGSQATARLLESECGVEPERIRVTPYGVDMPEESMTAAERRRFRERLVGQGNEMLLSVGMLETRKNVLNSLRALKLLSPLYHLVLAGGDGFGHEAIHAFIRDEKLEDRVHLLGYVPGEALPALYQSATVLLFPSFEEGFGFPVLEAMAHELPVVTSPTSSIPELGGDAALYADPNDPSAIASQVVRAVESPEIRGRMTARGLVRAREFTWQRTAEQTLAVYEELLSD